MKRPILLVVVPDGLAPVLGTALSLHPELQLRDGVAVGRLHAALDAHTRARVHSDKMPWDAGSDWVDELVAAQLGTVTRGGEARPVWRSHDAGSARALTTMLGAVPLVWVADGRHAMPPPVRDADPIASAVQAGRAWARSATAAEAVPGAVRVTTRTPPSALLAALELGRHAPTEQALTMLQHLGAPRLAPDRAAAFAAWPPAATRLATMGAAVPRPPAHPAVAAARARHAVDAGQFDEAATLARLALAGAPAPSVRREAISALLDAGHPDPAVAALERWRRSTDHPEAWAGLFALTDHPAPAALAHAARRHRDATVRGALARWLVRRGLDRQAAETVCRVRNTGWFAPLDAAPPPDSP
jgi:hypothetical protein